MHSSSDQVLEISKPQVVGAQLSEADYLMPHREVLLSGGMSAETVPYMENVVDRDPSMMMMTTNQDTLSANTNALTTSQNYDATDTPAGAFQSGYSRTQIAISDKPAATTLATTTSQQQQQQRQSSSGHATGASQILAYGTTQQQSLARTCNTQQSGYGAATSQQQQLGYATSSQQSAYAVTTQASATTSQQSGYAIATQPSATTSQQSAYAAATQPSAITQQSSGSAATTQQAAKTSQQSAYATTTQQSATTQLSGYVATTQQAANTSQLTGFAPTGQPQSISTSAYVQQSGSDAPLQFNADMSLSEQFGADKVGRDALGEFLIRRVEVPIKETVKREQRTVERRETVIEKKVPVVKEIVTQKEVKETKYNTIHREVEKVEVVDVTKHVDKHVDQPYEVEEQVKVPVEVIEFEEYNVPGEVIKVPKYYVVEQEVVVPRYVDKREPVIVAQSFYPIIVEAEDSDELTVDFECKIVSFTVQYQDVYVPVAVYRPALFESMVTQHKEVPISSIPEGQYNALVKELNAEADFKASADLFQYHHGIQNSALGSLFQTDRGPIYKQSGAGCYNVSVKDDRTVICTLHKNTLQPEQLIEQHGQHLLPGHTSGFSVTTSQYAVTTTNATTTVGGGGIGGTTLGSGRGTFGQTTNLGTNFAGAGAFMTSGTTSSATTICADFGHHQTAHSALGGSSMISAAGGTSNLVASSNDQENYFSSSFKPTNNATEVGNNSIVIKATHSSAMSDAAFFSTPTTTPEKNTQSAPQSADAEDQAFSKPSSHF